MDASKLRSKLIDRLSPPLDDYGFTILADFDALVAERDAARSKLHQLATAHALLQSCYEAADTERDELCVKLAQAEIDRLNRDQISKLALSERDESLMRANAERDAAVAACKVSRDSLATRSSGGPCFGMYFNVGAMDEAEKVLSAVLAKHKEI